MYIVYSTLEDSWWWHLTRILFLDWTVLDYGVDLAVAGLVVLAVPCLGSLHIGFSTHLTHVVLCALVPFDVVFKLVRLHKHFRAISTSKFFHAPMQSLVTFSGTGCPEHFITTSSALVRLLSCVKCHVLAQLALGLKLVGTLVAGKA